MGMLLSTMVFSKKTTDDLVYSVEKDLNSHIEEQDIKISLKFAKEQQRFIQKLVPILAQQDIVLLVVHQLLMVNLVTPEY